MASQQRGEAGKPGGKLGAAAGPQGADEVQYGGCPHPRPHHGVKRHAAGDGEQDPGLDGHPSDHDPAAEAQLAETTVEDGEMPTGGRTQRPGDGQPHVHHAVPSAAYRHQHGGPGAGG